MDDNHRSTSKDYYKVLEVDYDATDEAIKLNYRKLALKWHPDKHKGECTVTEKFQEINEAYTVLSDRDKRLEYDLNGNYEMEKYTLREYLSRFKGMILTCNGLGISHHQFGMPATLCCKSCLIAFSNRVPTSLPHVHAFKCGGGIGASHRIDMKFLVMKGLLTVTG